MVPINLSYLVSHKGKASSTVVHTCPLWSVEIWWMVTSRIACTILLLAFPHKKSYLQFLLAKNCSNIFIFFVTYICEGNFTQIIVCYIKCSVSE